MVIYLDHNATTPVAPEVVEALLPYLTQSFGNASSSYALGQEAKLALEHARSQVSIMLEAQSSAEILFLSGGTESINYAIKGSAYREKSTYKETNGRLWRNHIITSSVEHVAVLETCRALEKEGFEVTYLPVDGYGRVSVEDVIQALRPTTFFISIMLANNEVGTLQPIADVCTRVKSFVDEYSPAYGRILIHTDASQAIGKVKVSVRELGVDFLTIAGHKLYAPKGIGALYMKANAPVPATLIHGASHEQGRRAGTENVAFDVALGQACALITKNLDQYRQHMETSKAFLLAELRDRLKDVEFQVNGHPTQVLPNTLSVSFRGINAIKLLTLLETQGVFASGGSACHSHKEDDAKSIQISSVLAAMNVPLDFALGTLRLSVGRTTTQTELTDAASTIASSVRQLLK